MAKLTKIGCIIMLFLSLTQIVGCGLKGPLYMPKAFVSINK
ncbi:LPS translocon maturation chaperone LptM [Thorsellia kenyensis]|uniref:LPS-assembly lipoprotein LptM n=1 Tax=Thorsellia kenyensis TaxID=1549888 RepID=A0ABV6CCA4_9GAMM